MTKDSLNSQLRDYVKSNLSPSNGEQVFATSVYAALKLALGVNCILIGSYARFTASKPLHDIDVLYINGKFDPENLDPGSILSKLESQLSNNFENPTSYQIKFAKQSHSITISFMNGGEEKFSVDIVPAFTSGYSNDYGDDIYWVPEIIQVSKKKRSLRYDELSRVYGSENEWWLKSDPKGYIKDATDLNKTNSDFRKAVKFVKRWRHNCKEADQGFKLKSFHIEQAIYRIFMEDKTITAADAIFEFFFRLPNLISRPQIPDRADQNKFIDDYIAHLSQIERDAIIYSRDAFLIGLEDIGQISVSDLLKSRRYKRVSKTEEYLFDQHIPTFTDNSLSLNITARVLPRQGGFREIVLDKNGQIEVDRRINFSITDNTGNLILYKWKVKNDDNSPEPRGEITDHHTRNMPEHTKFNGMHFVECYAIKNGICIAKARQYVVLKRYL